MRTIKFRGKRVQEGRWVFGDLETRPGLEVAVIHQYDENGIQDASDYVNRNTVGQFTGLFDKNGTEVYEGDVLLCDGVKRTVEWDFAAFGLVPESGSPFEPFSGLFQEINNSEIIGNVYDTVEHQA